LTEEQFDRLMHEPIVATLATTTDNGYPWIVPIWFEWDGQAAWLLCRAKAAFVQHMTARPRVALLVDRHDQNQTRALLVGDAEVVAGPAPLSADARMADIAERLAVKYTGDAGREYIRQSFEWPRSLVRLPPRRVVSWGVVDWHPRYYREET
jgi:PPOX class probable F420-dependent enzyme